MSNIIDLRLPMMLEAAAHLGDRYISDRFLPDKAIDLIDEAEVEFVDKLKTSTWAKQIDKEQDKFKSKRISKRTEFWSSWPTKRKGNGIISKN